ncbi:MAG: GTPase Era [Deltaproteobacteria bacterium]|nr:GTPase Era [Deltaproteobacteria bacterium]
MKPKFRAGFIALVGRPNVGKSTLINQLIGEKVAIVSPKPQTTRTRIQGIINRDDVQMILVDTPGIVQATSVLRRCMRRTASTVIDGADVTLLVVDCSSGVAKLNDADREALKVIGNKGGKLIVALNKIDAILSKDLLLPWIALYNETLSPTALVPISALSSDGLDELLKLLIDALPESEPLFDRDLHTDQAERFLCGELIREQMLLQLRAEVPHAAAVMIESFDDQRRDDGSGLVRIEGCIYVERESQKGIVVGKKGTQIKKLGQEARQAIEAMLGCKVYLHLVVRVATNWSDKDREVQRFGYNPDHRGDSW